MSVIRTAMVLKIALERSRIRRPKRGRVELGSAACSNGDHEAFKIARVVREEFDAVLPDDDRIGVAETAKSGCVQTRLDSEDHAGLQHSVVAGVEERSFVIP